MLNDVETGYEAKFDFPLTAGQPEIVYLLATVPRTGSTYLSHILWQTGCLGAPLEYLNFEPGSPYGFAAGLPDAQQQVWRSVLRSRTSPNGVFGLKSFQLQLQDLHRDNPPLLSAVLSTMLSPRRPKRVIYLGRRDRIAHVVSYARASMSGIWRKEQEQANSGKIEYCQEMLDAAERGIKVQEGRWEQMFQDLRIDPLRLWYEDVIARPADATQMVADYLGVTIEPSAAVQVPPILKQSEGDSSAWIARYAASQGIAPPGQS